MAKQFTSRNLVYTDLEIVDYQEAWDLQHSVFNARLKNEIDDQLFLLEHPHTYTLGKTADKANLIGDNEFLSKYKIMVYNIDRGGDITYHGPGQIVGYSILDLKNWRMDTHKYLRALEEVIIKVCAHYGLITGRKEGLTGVWIDDRKICALGIKVSRWITMHGFAFNVNTNLDLFQGIIPCGINDKEVTSLKSELGRQLDLNEVKQLIVQYFKEVFSFESIHKGSRNELLAMMNEKTREQE